MYRKLFGLLVVALAVAAFVGTGNAQAVNASEAAQGGNAKGVVLDAPKTVTAIDDTCWDQFHNPYPCTTATFTVHVYNYGDATATCQAAIGGGISYFVLPPEKDGIPSKADIPMTTNNTIGVKFFEVTLTCDVHVQDGKQKVRLLDS